MPFMEFEGKKVEVNEEGFLLRPEDWSEELAKMLAEAEGIDELTEDHWKVINYIRQYYLDHDIAPMVRLLCKETGFPLRYIYQLFTSGPARGACKLAGLPKPDGCV
ncbi:MAG: TusE/DsrC/DsvC family sulfur relay protein [Candidatus Aminicenantes bacterium]|nr:TusE/DsrC/DsvC family sulfur relay protein [Candidatus Aminicenantes bacterium]MDH5715289.1 TusE/DsrC/DsvC family sulfur relay protein [Candidatus Aminicenantes bacterium]